MAMCAGMEPVAALRSALSSRRDLPLSFWPCATSGQPPLEDYRTLDDWKHRPMVRASIPVGLGRDAVTWCIDCGYFRSPMSAFVSSVLVSRLHSSSSWSAHPPPLHLKIIALTCDRLMIRLSRPRPRITAADCLFVGPARRRRSARHSAVHIVSQEACLQCACTKACQELGRLVARRDTAHGFA